MAERVGETSSTIQDDDGNIIHHEHIDNLTMGYGPADKISIVT